MAVYTVLDAPLLVDFLGRFGLGRLRRFEGIAAGVENTNYWVSTEPVPGRAGGEYVLTVFERLGARDLAFHIRLLHLLGRAGLPVPEPVPDREGRALQELVGKPALLMPRLPGAHPAQPTPEQCRAMGRALGIMHRHTLAAALRHQGYRDLAWLSRAGARQLARLDGAAQALLREELAQLRGFMGRPLPRAIIHGDLFRDNALFEGAELTGIIDFFSAGTGFLLLDLAILVNDWCGYVDGMRDARCEQALLLAYAAERPPTKQEQDAWGDSLRAAALRFWVSRLQDAHQPSAAVALPNVKDPAVFQALLQQHRAQPGTWPLR